MPVGLIVWLWLSGADSAGIPPPAVAAELARLEGHTVTVAPDGSSYAIENAAGEGKPLVGVVERRANHLVLVCEDGAAYRLHGILARPRIAGPGYKVWILGEIAGTPAAPILIPRRLGILAPPW